MSKALIAMSGGVDSSVAAFLVKRQGYDCIAATMKLFDNEDIGEDKKKSCCSLEDVQDARSVANRLGIPFYVFNFTADFKERVMEKFVEAYRNGETPNPCIDCNRYMKFEKLLHRAKQLGFDYLVTGHYARIEYKEDSRRYLLKKGIDESKDQSYVLYAMTQEQLKSTIFPLGGLHKEQVRRLAEEIGLVNAGKQDSQDICFVPNGDYADFIEQYFGKRFEHGDFLDKQGNILGTHNGIIRYTVGQRKGLGLSFPEPVYVLSKDAHRNTVTLGSHAELLTAELYAGDFNWIAYENPQKPFYARAKVRYRQKEQPAFITPLSDGTVHIHFEQPVRAVAKGQAVVLYDEDTVIGGGKIL